jgi:hypothetical protein
MKPENEQTNKSGKSEAEIDEALEETFPASDPPPWTLGTDSRHLRERGDTDRPPRERR